ncbi:unnamed protein product [Rotaria sp. Silwood2]|nr:unnamed protein product [Rotaria sp. Silwood2]
MKHPLEHSQAHRGSGTFDETRDVPGSHYATDWWINHFSGIRSENRRASSISFKKKHRDQIQWNGALLPFRRSGLLAEKIANDWLSEQSYRQEERQRLLSLILQTSASIEGLKNRISQDTLQRILILRGLLSSEVLFVTLAKRYRVNCGVNPNPKFNRRMTVPFRAKDVAANNTEFGHPDIAIVLTQPFYYYNGLTNEQMLECFKRLSDGEKHPE